MRKRFEIFESYLNDFSPNDANLQINQEIELIPSQTCTEVMVTKPTSSSREVRSPIEAP